MRTSCGIAMVDVWYAPGQRGGSAFSATLTLGKKVVNSIIQFTNTEVGFSVDRTLLFEASSDAFHYVEAPLFSCDARKFRVRQRTANKQACMRLQRLDGRWPACAAAVNGFDCSTPAGTKCIYDTPDRLELGMRRTARQHQATDGKGAY